MNKNLNKNYKFTNWLERGIVGMLTAIFVFLKLSGVIHWSWMWVLSPVWIYGVIIVVLLLIIHHLEHEQIKDYLRREYHNKR